MIDVAEYVGNAYASGNTLFNVQQGEDDGCQTISISCHNYKNQAFWTGEWISTWSLQAGQLSGSIVAKSHYFENGNVAFHIAKDFDSIAVKDPSKAS